MNATFLKCVLATPLSVLRTSSRSTGFLARMAKATALWGSVLLRMTSAQSCSVMVRDSHGDK